jgi:hypothetical protein
MKVVLSKQNNKDNESTTKLFLQRIPKNDLRTIILPYI